MAESPPSNHCPDCGTRLSTEAWGENLCLRCLLHLAAPTLHSAAAPVAEAPTEVAPERLSTAPTAVPGEEPTVVSEEDPTAAGPSDSFSFSAGQVLGDRYRVLKLLGRGGMGEVWRAYDLKLRVDVALKSLHASLAGGEEGLELLRSEVRAAREVISPNVCRLFDLIEVGGEELVSMEYIDGQTLLELLKERGPLEVQEAREIGSQFLAGLEAIHQADLVHRDIKPENIMLTRSGRVVVMDFGLTSPTGEGEVSGTPAYMAPEQGCGEGTDARADVFSAGMVLAEMLSAERGPEDSSRQSFWEKVRRDPPELPDSPWKRVLLGAVAVDRNERYASAAELARKLEEIAVRVEGAEDKKPYPGLESFSEDAAEFFFGREAEVEAAWKKLQQAFLLGLIGASGSGKSSFVNAGLLPAKPEGWDHLLIKPGRDPFGTLSRALGDAHLSAPTPSEREIYEALVDWRARHPQVLLIVDQFEELFTQNSFGVQESFVALVSRAALDGDLHVLLSMRDDFLLRCHDFDSLDPLFSELTPLKAPVGSALRRALTQPALRCGYRFEDEEMVEEMLAEVTKERGALPLISFTAARLWEERDREGGLLTRAAYDEMGGVGGALAQHAEATLDRVGRDKTPIVRELFRNLVTAQGTRAIVGVDEVLSVFAEAPDGVRVVTRAARTGRKAAAGAVQSLIDARLLTSYEVATTEGEVPERRVEIVHESLLSAWPRLVRWRTQDAEGAQLRDELRQAAKLWDERGRTEDRLWTGATYREFVVWRERYPGGLTALEEEYAHAMVELAGRTKRRRRLATAATIVFLVVGLVTVGGFWKQSETARQEAIEEARRAEASKLVALGRNALREDSSEAIAHALESLDLIDQEPARLLALEALWYGPTALRIATEEPAYAAISPDGTSMAIGHRDGTVRIMNQDGGHGPVVDGHESTAAYLDFITPEILMSWGYDRRVKLWSLPDLGSIQTLPVQTSWAQAVPSADGRAGLVTWEESGRVKWWAAAGGEPIVLGSVAREEDRRFPLVFDVIAASMIDPVGRSLIYARSDHIFREPLDELGLAEPELIVVAPSEIADYGLKISPDGSMVAAWFSDAPGLRLWSLEPPYAELPLPPLPASVGELAFSRDSARLAAATRDNNFHIWDLRGPPDAEPLMLHRRGTATILQVGFSPDSSLLVTVEPDSVDLWPIGRRHARELRQASGAWSIGIAPDRSWVAATGQGGWIWPARRAAEQMSRQLLESQLTSWCMAVSPDGSMISVAPYDGNNSQVLVLASDGTSTRAIQPFKNVVLTVAFDGRGRILASGGGYAQPEDAFINLWDLETDATWNLDPGHGTWITHLAFTPDGQLIESSLDSLAIWDLSAGTRRRLRNGPVWEGQPGPYGNSVVFLEGTGRYKGIPRQIDTDSGEALPIAEWGAVGGLRVTRSGEMIGSTSEGTIQVGALAGGKPHLLFGHEGLVINVTQASEWIVTAEDERVRIWPKPDVSETPFHLLPYEELLTKLRAMTNIRVVRDESSDTGYRTEVGEFPGWEVVPEW